MISLYFYFCVALIIKTGVCGVNVSITSDGPAVLGSNITFTATVLGYTDEEFKFEFYDNIQPQHKYSVVQKSNSTVWIQGYPRDLYKAGQYMVYVDLKKYFYGVWFLEASASTTFQLTSFLNGKLMLNQNNTDRPNSFVAVNKSVHHYVKLPDNEIQFLEQNASSIVTHWFLDCVFFDTTIDFALNYTYEDTMTDHHIEAIVVANNEPLPPITTTTTTTKPPPTTTPKLVTSTETEVPSTTEKNVTNANDTTVHKVQKRAISNRTFKNSVREIVCNNTIPVGKNYTIGRYQQTISVREPISKVDIAGHNWLQHGDLLDLQVKYSGSPPFDYCIIYKLGQYNVTGNETCKTTRTVSNEFPLVHYFSDVDQHTVVVVIGNDIGNFVSSVTVNIYKAPGHAQLSVIVVPVFFCLVAVILVVFGIAYYQHRSRHSVEVADFDFGQANPEYKTFSERLRDSFRNAFNFGHRDDTDPLTPDTRYDSMT